jgi:urease accessory protein
MLELTRKLASHDHNAPSVQARVVDGVLSLPFEIRQKSRFRACLTDGTEVGVVIDRGSVLRGGDVLASPQGSLVSIEAAAEAVSIVTHDNPIQVARAAYHLGNRHVPLQVSECGLCYLRDHVLDKMCTGLGLHVRHEEAPFEPESGAYGSGHTHHD